MERLIGVQKSCLNARRDISAAFHGGAGPYIAGGAGGGQLPPPGKLNVFFSNIVFDFVGLFLVDILVRNLKKTD